MNAVPERLVAGQLGLSERDACPSCSTSDADGTRRWVRCPMFDSRAICYGCCLDLQDLARSLDFEEDPFRDLFSKVGRLTGKDVRQLRATCLEHQQELIGIQLVESHESEERDALVRLASRVAGAVLQVMKS